MYRRKLIKMVGLTGSGLGLAGCSARSESGDGGSSNPKWGLPSCDSSDHSVKVRGASIIDSQYDGMRSSYRTEIRVVVEVLGANKQVVRVKSFDILDKNDDKVGEVTRYESSDNLELEPAATKSFEFTERTSEEAAKIDNIVVQAMTVDEWEASSLADWEYSDNKGCS